MKRSEKYALWSLGIGVAASIGFYVLWPKAHWAVYPVLALIVAGYINNELVKNGAALAMLDGTEDKQEQRRTKRSQYSHSALSHSWTYAALMDSLVDLPGGSPSQNQLRALERLGMGEIPDDLNSEQASAILSARTYATAAAEKAINDPKKARAALPGLISFIVSDPPLRDRVIKWNERSFARGGGDTVSPKKDEYWMQVFAEAERIAREL